MRVGLEINHRMLTMNPILNLTACKLCGSHNIVKFGRYRGIQRWWCKTCLHKFADNDAVTCMKTPSTQVASAIEMYFAGVRPGNIPEKLYRHYTAFVTSASIYNWIIHFSKRAISETNKTGVEVGDTWTALESVTRNDIKEINVSLIDIIDTRTLFLLGTKLSYSRSQYDIRLLMESAISRAGKAPEELLTDGWKGYLDGIKSAAGKSGSHIRVMTLDNAWNIEPGKSWSGITNARTKIIRGLRKKENIQLILDGWLIHYNYFRPHESLEGKTPAEAAGTTFRFHHWLDFVQKSNR